MSQSGNYSASGSLEWHLYDISEAHLAFIVKVKTLRPGRRALPPEVNKSLFKSRPGNSKTQYKTDTVSMIKNNTKLLRFISKEATPQQQSPGLEFWLYFVLCVSVPTIQDPATAPEPQVSVGML